MPRRIQRGFDPFVGKSPAEMLEIVVVDHLKIAKEVSKYVELAHINDLKKKLRMAKKEERTYRFVAYGPNVSRSFIEGLEDTRMELESRIEGLEENYLKVTKHFSPGWEKTV